MGVSTRILFHTQPKLEENIVIQLNQVIEESPVEQPIVKDALEPIIEVEAQPLDEFTTYYEEGIKEIDTITISEPGMETPNTLLNQEIHLYKYLDKLNNKYIHNSIFEIEQEQKRQFINSQNNSIKFFSKSFARSIQDLYKNFIKDKVVKVITDYDLENLQYKLSNTKLDKNLVKSQSISNISPYVELIRRFNCYNTIVNGINDIESMLLDPVLSDKDLGSSLQKIITFVNGSKFNITISDKGMISGFKSFIDIRPGYNYYQTKTLQELGYSYYDIIGLCNKFKKLKLNIHQASIKIQDNIKPSGNNSSRSERKTLYGLIKYTKNDKDRIRSDKADMTRLYRIAMLVSIFNSICNYGFREDYNNIKRLLIAVSNIQE